MIKMCFISFETGIMHALYQLIVKWKAVIVDISVCQAHLASSRFFQLMTEYNLSL